MVPAARLRHSIDIANVRSSGRSLRRSAFSARVLARDRAGVRVTVTGPRTLGGAVVRNRLRRRVREAFRRAIASSEPARGLDIVVTVRPEAATADARVLEADATAILRDAP